MRQERKIKKTKRKRKIKLRHFCCLPALRGQLLVLEIVPAQKYLPCTYAHPLLNFIRSTFYLHLFLLNLFPHRTSSLQEKKKQFCALAARANRTAKREKKSGLCPSSSSFTNSLYFLLHSNLHLFFCCLFSRFSIRSLFFSFIVCRARACVFVCVSERAFTCLLVRCCALTTESNS